MSSDNALHTASLRRSSTKSIDNATLKAVPYGEEKCANCRYYLEDTADISYCWHPKLRILVGAQWWCQWWDAIPE